jgi:hypothetical protein
MRFRQAQGRRRGRVRFASDSPARPVAVNRRRHLRTVSTPICRSAAIRGLEVPSAAAKTIFARNTARNRARAEAAVRDSRRRVCSSNTTSTAATATKTRPSTGADSTGADPRRSWRNIGERGSMKPMARKNPPGRSPRLRLRPLPQRPRRLAHTPDELTRRSTRACIRYLGTGLPSSGWRRTGA